MSDVSCGKYDRGKWYPCQCLTCVYNCDSEHWQPGEHWIYDDDFREEDFCYFCEEHCYEYDYGIHKHVKSQTECTKYKKSIYYVWQEEQKAAREAEQASSKLHVIKG